jgi:RNA polymerase sigma-70 factor (ECF subfamily)
MEIKFEDFAEKEKVFIERTGKNFDFYYKKYYPKLIYYTNKICNDTQKAEDVSIDSFLTAFDKIDMYESDKSQFSTWLFTIARNLALQEKKTNSKSISMDVEIDEEGTTMKDFIQEEESEDEAKYEAINMKAQIMLEAIGKLKEPYKRVIEMREVRKMQYKDISEQLGKNLSTIKSQIRNGRGLLVKSTEKEFQKIDSQFS